MKRLPIILLLSICLPTNALAGRIRTLSLHPYQIGKIKITLNQATLVEVPSKNFKIIAGAPDFLDIEYQPDSFLIKPKAKGIKTNLFILTPIGRFNLHVESVHSKYSDEVVTLRFKPTPRRK